MLDFNKLFFAPYWLTRNPNALSKNYLYAWLAVSIAMLVVAFVGKRVVKRNDQLPAVWVSWYMRVASMLYTMGFLSLMLVFFRYERIPLFAARWWMLLWLAGVFVWSIKIWRGRSEIEKKLEKKLLVQRLEKYLPKRKK